MQLSLALGLRSGDVVALAGAGGKSSALFRLGEEALQNGRRALLTTTTRVFTRQTLWAPHVLRWPKTLAEVRAALDAHGCVLLVSAVDLEAKTVGVEAAVVNELAAAGIADVIAVEADGSRLRSFKAPAPHEPVIPAATTMCVPVVGLSVLGQPLDTEHVHRLERVMALTGARAGIPINEDLIARVMAHAEGGLHQAPGSARIAPLLNQADDAAQVAAGARIAAQVLQNRRIERVAVASLQRENPVWQVEGRYTVVVLAAGGASRFGAPKQLVDWGGEPLVVHVTRQALASRAARVVVVIGYSAERVRAAMQTRVDQPRLQVVENPVWAEGQSTSVRVGVQALQKGSVLGAIFLPVDQPGITPALLNELMKVHGRTLAPVVSPRYAGRSGSPRLLDSSLFPELVALSGDTGGRVLLDRFSQRAEYVELHDETPLRDIDTLADYQRWRPH